MWESLVLGTDYSWFQFTSLLNSKKNTVLFYQMDHWCFLSGINVFGGTVNFLKHYGTELVRSESWAWCFETVFAPFWFVFAPSCEVPLTVIQIVTFTCYQIRVRQAKEGSTLDRLWMLLSSEDDSIWDSPSRLPTCFPQESNSLRCVLLLWKNELKHNREYYSWVPFGI